jgi:ubiquinone/menaquinone biosynthesis C-methylase UbiE
MNNWLWRLKAKIYRPIRSGFPFNLVLKFENNRLNDILKSIAIKDLCVIDLGTGTGNVIQFLPEANRILGIDKTFEMLQQAWASFPNTKFIRADALAIPLKSNSVELITAIGLTEYIENLSICFSEVQRLLKRNGYFVVSYSPSGLWTRLRLLLGHAIFPKRLEQLIEIAKQEQMQLIKSSRTLMQGQILFQKV